ncbi:efflux RND transporter permease subunit [Parasphingopyxis marina]|uniref:Efflux RND transporter permease subunit n=1 Tax=Parasphingopyxis marina TaxID=2761622 RepID=A0A842I326_9SPHN|nr:efflux RND transporter permease subunit [Parasphingopyxis marina]MBC2778730.1 efflux RND transporter permease subunit [Parasphingopyxis marina]
MSFRTISTWAIKNPTPPLVLFAGLMLAGIISFMRLDVNDSPDVDFPAVIVQVSQPGAAPSEMETQVTQRVEAAVRNINGVDEIQSTVQEGRSQTFIQFAIGTPVDRSVNDVRNAVALIRGDLPDGILEPQVTRVEVNGGGTIAFFAVESVDMTLEELSWFVDNTIARRLLGIDGMAAVDRSGGVDREIRVVLDPAQLEALGITASQINSQLRATNLNAAGGRAEVAGAEQSVRVLGDADTAYELGQTDIAIGNGRTVQLSSIADVRDQYGEQRTLSKMNGRQVVSFGVERAKGASDVSVYDSTVEMLEQMEEEYPGVTFTRLFTSVEYTKSNYDAAMNALVEGAVLAVIVVFLFLRDWRATLIAAIAIPLSAIPTFWFMELLGFTLNFISLLALSLVAGVLVDDAIVEIENIVRHMRMGKNSYQASIDAAEEISLAVLATTMAIVAVFLPVALMPGISGQFFIQFGMTTVIAVLMSLAVARLITPLISAYFMKAEGVHTHGEGPLMDRYMALLKWSLVHRWKTALIGGGGALVLTVVSASFLPMVFMPNEDNDFSRVTIEMVPGSTLRQTERVSDRVAAILRAQPEVRTAFQRIEPGSGRIFMSLKDDRERSSIDFERETLPLLRSVADARVYFNSQQGGFSGRDISLTIGGDDPDALDDAADAIVTQMSALDGVVAPRVDGGLRRPEIIVEPRLDLAADLGVTTAALSQAIRIATQGDIDQNAARFSLSDRQIPIRVILSEAARRDLANIENLPVPTASGGSVPLSAVAEIRFGSGPTVIERYNQQRRIVIGADLAPGVVSASEQIDALPIWDDLPDGVERVYAGPEQWQAEMIFNFIVAVISGVLLVFAVLVLLYRRIVAPLVNMGSLILAPLGSFLALLITGNALSLPVFIGLLMLLGIVAKNSILLVDFAIEEMDKGVDKVTALIDAGHKRAQPIVMTTVAMTAGMIPTAIAIHGDSAFRSPMGWTVIGGLLLSTVLTLVIVPASFSIADSVEQKFRRVFGRALTYKPTEEEKGAVQPAE